MLITCTLKLKQIRHCVRASAFQIGMEIQHREVVFVLHFLPFLPWFELFLLYAVFSYSMLLCPLRGMSVSVLYGWVQHIYLFFNSFVHFILAVTNTSFPFQHLAGWGSLAGPVVVKGGRNRALREALTSSHCRPAAWAS